MFAPVRGATVLLPSGPANDVTRKHLFVLLTDPRGPAKQVLMVPICSLRDIGADDSCLLDAGCHPFIQHQSYVAYARCRVEAAADLAKHVGSGYLVEKEPASEALLNQIASGLSKSKFTKPFAKEFLREFEASRKASKTK